MKKTKQERVKQAMAMINAGNTNAEIQAAVKAATGYGFGPSTLAQLRRDAAKPPPRAWVRVAKNRPVPEEIVMKHVDQTPPRPDPIPKEMPRIPPAAIVLTLVKSKVPFSFDGDVITIRAT